MSKFSSYTNRSFNETFKKQTNGCMTMFKLTSSQADMYMMPTLMKVMLMHVICHFGRVYNKLPPFNLASTPHSFKTTLNATTDDIQ